MPELHERPARSEPRVTFIVGERGPIIEKKVIASAREIRNGVPWKPYRYRAVSRETEGA